MKPEPEHLGSGSLNVALESKGLLSTASTHITESVSTGSESFLLVGSSGLPEESLSQSQTSDGSENMPSVMTREEMQRRLLDLETKHNMKSEKFYMLWQQGKAPGSMDTLRWVTLWEAWKANYLIDR